MCTVLKVCRNVQHLEWYMESAIITDDAKYKVPIAIRPNKLNTLWRVKTVFQLRKQVYIWGQLSNALTTVDITPTLCWLW